jgi:cbb3-type cytochrome oxidase maturation protein
MYFCFKIKNMSVIIVLVILSLVLAVGFLLAFLWSVKSGQLDDDKTPAMRILFDDHQPKSTKSIK